MRPLAAARSTVLLATLTLWPAAPLAAQARHSLPARDAALTGEPRQVFAVGTENGREWETFANVPAVAFDDAGNLHVLDRGNARILVFDRSGRHLRTVGRKGGGPGEMQLPVTMAVARDGRIVVFDLATNVLSIFGSDGTYASLVRPPQDVRATPTVTMPMQGDDAVVLLGAALAGPDGMEIRNALPLHRIPLAGGGSTVLYEAPSTPPQVQASGTASAREVRLMPPPSFSPSVSLTALPDGRVAVAHGTEYAVRLIAPEGGVSAIISRPIDARPVAEADRESARDQTREALSSGAGQVRMEVVNGERRASIGGRGLPAEQVEGIVAQMRFADVVPAVRAIAADWRGRIWIRRAGGPGRADEGPIDIVTAAGEYVGTVSGIELPDAFGPDGLAAWIEQDDLGVQRVVVKQIPW